MPLNVDRFLLGVAFTALLSGCMLPVDTRHNTSSGRPQAIAGAVLEASITSTPLAADTDIDVESTNSTLTLPPYPEPYISSHQNIAPLVPEDAAGHGIPGADISTIQSDAQQKALFRQEGVASWYGKKFSGRRTANGERFSPDALTAAHRTLPFGSYVRVTGPAGGRSVVVRINDRGPYVRGRVIDLSYAAAAKIGLHRAGIMQVTLERVVDNNDQ